MIVVSSGLFNPYRIKPSSTAFFFAPLLRSAQLHTKFLQNLGKKFKSPATSYPPRQLPTKYFRRWKTLLLCSVWEQVWPFRHRRETSLALFQAIENRLKRIGSMER